MSDEIDKYKILIDLLKHQDSQINSVLTWNAVIQGFLLTALLTTMKLDVMENNSKSLLLIPFLGAIFAIFWILSGIRLKDYTDYYIKRLKEFENAAPTLKDEDFKLFVDGELEIKRGISKALYLVYIPFLITLTWCIIFGCIWCSIGCC